MNRKHSMSKLIILSLLLIVFLQAVFFMVNIMASGASKKIIEDTYANITRNAQNKRAEIERKIINSWANHNNMRSVFAVARHMYLNNKLDSLDERFNLAQAIINMINSTQSSGALVYIDGYKDEDALSFYIQDANTNLVLSDLSDISLSLGDSRVARKLSIALNSSWRKDNTVSDFIPFEEFFEKTKNIMKEIKEKDIKNVGYLEYSLNHAGEKVWYYISPLYSEETTTQFGFIAVEINLKLIDEMFYYEELSDKSTSAYILAKQNKNNNLGEFDILSIKGAYIKNLLSGDKIYLNSVPERKNKKLGNTKDSLVYKVKIESNQNFLAIEEPIRIKNENFSQEDSYYLFAIVDKKEIEFASTEFQNGIVIMIILTIIIGFLLAILLSRKLTRDIVMISEEIKNNRQGKDFNIKPTGIIELDNLVNVINNLSSRLTQNSNKFQNILEISSASVVAIEIDIEKEKVYRIGKFNSIFKDIYEKEEFEEILSLRDFEMNQSMLFENAILYKEYFDEKTKSNIQILEKMWKGETKFVKIITNKQYLSDIDSKKSTQKGIISKIILDNTSEVTEQLEILKQRDTDSLTGLFNRLSFNEQIIKRIQEKPDIKAAMIMWDMDELKYINDTFGHDHGDRYLISMAKALRVLENDNTIIARISGDEFFVFMIYEEDKEEVLVKIEQLRNMLAKTNLDYLNNISIKVTTGISWYPDDTENIQELLKYADFAMYTAKHRKKGTMEEFNRDEYEQNYILLSGNQHFYDFLEKREVKYAFQPIVDARTAEIYSYEALMRPTSKHLRNIGSVMKFAKYQSKLTEIEILTFDEVLKFVSENLEKFEGKKVFINSIANVSLPYETINYIQNKYSDILGKLVIEIIEQEDLEDRCLKVKQSFRENFGCRIAIDDFGSGYSSQAWFLQVHPDFAKIDMSLINGIDKDLEKQEIVKHIVSYSSKMNIKVICEGVETYEEMQTLIKLDVDYLQGYYLARPSFDVVDIPDKIKNEIIALQNVRVKMKENN